MEITQWGNAQNLYGVPPHTGPLTVTVNGSPVAFTMQGDNVFSLNTQAAPTDSVRVVLTQTKFPTDATLGSNVITVGAGGRYRKLYDAINAVCPDEYSNFVSYRTVTGSPASQFSNQFSHFLLLPGETLRTGTPKVRPGDYIRKVGETRRHRIKKVVADTAIELYEAWAGSALSGTTEFIVEYLDWKYFMLLPGEHTFSVLWPDGGFLPHGVHLLGSGRDVSTLSEDADGGASGRIFSAVGACRFSHLTLGPTRYYGAMDGIVSGHFDGCPAGSDILFENVHVISSNPGGVHSGSGMHLPVNPGSRTIIRASDFESESYFQLGVDSSAVTTPANTTLDIIGSRFTVALGMDTSLSGQVGGGVGVCGLWVSEAITLNMVGSSVDFPDMSIDPYSGNVCGIKVTEAAVININASRVNVANTDPSAAAVTIGVSVDAAAATVNISQSDIEAAGTSGTGVYNNGGIVTVRTGSRVKGTANKAINNAAGTVRVSPNADVIGGTTGTIAAVAT